MSTNDQSTALASLPETRSEHQNSKSQATQIVELASNCELFHNAEGEGFVRFYTNGHFEVGKLNSQWFRRWIGQEYYQQHKHTISSQAINDAIGVLEGKAQYEGAKRECFIRVAEHEGHYYLDLCNERWQVVEIDGAGWRVLDESPVMFRRAKGMLALPVPVQGGHVNELRDYINVSDEQWPLVLAWLVAALRPVGPYPILGVHGEHGSAKSTTSRNLRAIIDPNSAPLRSAPRNEHDLMITAKKSQVLALDNLSTVPVWLSDALCRLATGGGFAVRTLYQNDEETIFEAQRPCLLNGIEEVATRPDLADRCLILNLPRIDGAQRRSEAELNAKFKQAKPRILGALLGAVAEGISRLPQISLPSLPRMADFAVWVVATEPALGLEPGAFLAAYEANQRLSTETAIETSAIGKAICELVAELSQWEGTATELLEALQKKADDRTMMLKDWPKSPSSLSGKLRRLAPSLRIAGITVEFQHKCAQKKTIELGRKTGEDAVTAVTSSEAWEDVEEVPSLIEDGTYIGKDSGVTQSVTCDSEGYSYLEEDFFGGDACDGDDADLQDFPSFGVAESDQELGTDWGAV